MTSIRYHGLVVLKENSGHFRFGIANLISMRSSLSWIGVENKSELELNAIRRFHNQAYWQCTNKFRDVVHKLNKALYELSKSISIVEEKDKYAYDGASMETAAIYYRALEDIPYHLDAFISYLRILADCVSFALPFFYKTKESISNRSFRDHMNWFQKKKPEFDPEYTKILNKNTSWFENLAGKNEKGFRDINFHRFGTYQIGWTNLQDGTHQILVSQVTSEGIVRQNLISSLEETIHDFFRYLDLVYELFSNRFKSELPTVDWDLEKRSTFMNLEMFNIRSKYQLYPVINDAK